MVYEARGNTSRNEIDVEGENEWSWEFVEPKVKEYDKEQIASHNEEMKLKDEGKR